MQTMKEIFAEIETNGGMTPSRRLRDIANRFPEQIAFRIKGMVSGMRCLIKNFGWKFNMLVAL